MDIFTKRLNELIKEKGITRYQLSKAIKVNPQTIYFWCTGTNEPKISYLKAIADYFQVCSDYLLGRQDWY